MANTRRNIFLPTTLKPSWRNIPITRDVDPDDLDTPSSIANLKCPSLSDEFVFGDGDSGNGLDWK